MMVGPGMHTVPSVVEMERHYYELSEQKRKLEEMLDKTDRMMAGLKRGMDEMRGVGSAQVYSAQVQQQQQQQQHMPMPRMAGPGAPGPGAMALPLALNPRADGERREPVWPVIDADSQPRE